jgi:hypothetical protein
MMTLRVRHAAPGPSLSRWQEWTAELPFRIWIRLHWQAPVPADLSPADSDAALGPGPPAIRSSDNPSPATRTQPQWPGATRTVTRIVGAQARLQATEPGRSEPRHRAPASRP